MRDTCNVILTKEEIRLRNKEIRDRLENDAEVFFLLSHHPMRYGDKCNSLATQFFRIESLRGDPVLVCRCDVHVKVFHGINDEMIMKLTYEEAIISEVHDA